MEQASREHAFPAASQVKQNLDGAGLVDFGITLFPGLAGGEKEHGEDGPVGPFAVLRWRIG